MCLPCPGTAGRPTSGVRRWLAIAMSWLAPHVEPAAIIFSGSGRRKGRREPTIKLLAAVYRAGPIADGYRLESRNAFHLGDSNVHPVRQAMRSACADQQEMSHDAPVYPSSRRSLHFAIAHIAAGFERLAGQSRQ